MKYSFLILCLMIGIVLYSQDYMEIIAKKSCDCLEQASDTLTEEEVSIELGLCMIEAASSYERQLKKDYGIDFSKIDEQGEKLGKIIGMRMISICPNALIQMANKINDDTEEPVVEIFKGTITKIEDELFVIFSAKNEQGKTTKFYWLSFIEADLDLPSNYQVLNGKPVTIEYRTEEFFDPRINEYRNCNIIEKINIGY